MAGASTAELAHLANTYQEAMIRVTGGNIRGARQLWQAAEDIAPGSPFTKHLLAGLEDQSRAARETVEALTRSFNDTYVAAARGYPTVRPTVPNTPKQLPGQRWSSPLTRARGMVKDGESLNDALAATAPEVGNIADRDVLTAARDATVAAAEDHGVNRFKRQPERNACPYCQKAAERPYFRSDLRPIHDFCHCIVVPLIGNTGMAGSDKPAFPTGGNVPDTTAVTAPVRQSAEAIAREVAPGRSTRPPTATKPSDMLDFASKKAAKLFEDLAKQLDDLHGIADDALGVTDVVAGGKTKRLGGSFNPAPRKPKPRRPNRKTATAEDRAAYNTAHREWLNDPERLRPRIKVNQHAGGEDADVLSFLHEFGHRVDAVQDVPEGSMRFVSASGQNSDDVAKAVTEFRDAAMNNAYFEDAVRSFRSAGERQYFRSPEEVWARAYSQWSAERLGLGEAIDATLAIDSHYQWPRELFREVVAPKVEAILRARGLMT